MVCEAIEEAHVRSKRGEWWKQDVQTPYLAIKLEEVQRRYREFRKTMPKAEVYYAVKANPARPVASALANLGSSFDVASANELLMVLDLGVPPSRISFGNTVKRAADIQLAYRIGVRHFAADSIGEIDKLAALAPGSYVMVRLLVSCQGAEWPLSRKFGCDREMAVRLLRYAKAVGLQPVGVSFHVGSQQTNPHAWDEPIREAAGVFAEMASDGVELQTLNLGGGFPANYLKRVPTLGEYNAAIEESLRRWFPERVPELMIEPGRGLVADAGVLVSEVLLSSRKSANDDHRWVYLDCGLFGGLIEALGEAIRYRIETERDGDLCGPAVIAGPTCDSADLLYERNPYPLPLSLRSGDKVRLLSTGAYTFTCGMAGFNGFGPLQCICV